MDTLRCFAINIDYKLVAKIIKPQLTSFNIQPYIQIFSFIKKQKIHVDAK